jgi:gluconokinase
MSCIIGVDIGTSSTKLVAYTEHGQVIASAQKPYSILQSQPGFQEQDPITLFDAFVNCMDELTSKIDPSEIAGLAFSCAMHGLMALDENDRPLTNIITWADTRSQDEATAIKNSPDAEYLNTRTGLPIHPMAPLYKIMWLKKNQPAIFGKAKMFAGYKEYLFNRLLGVWISDYALAASTGMLDVFELDWNEKAVSMAGIEKSQLPTPVSSIHSESNLKKEFTERWKLPAGTPFIIGSSDGCLANLGTGAINYGDMAVTVGTSGAVRIAHNELKTDEKGRTFTYPLADNLFIQGGALNNGGIILKWFAENFLDRSFEQSSDFAWFLEQAGKVNAGCDGLICLPYFMGERAPVYDAAAKGIFFGVQLHHRREHFMRAIVEGISMSLYQIAAILISYSGKPRHIYASGGFVKSDQWMQILADIFNQPIHVTNTSDASAIGAAMVGWYSLGKIESLNDAQGWVEIQRTFFPDADNVGTYENNFRIFSQLYDRNNAGQ